MDSVTGLVFTIIRGSFVDGWGIRTTIFLKGCPLRCTWCCNPESQTIGQQLKLTRQDCTMCGACRDICPALTLSEDGPHADRQGCDLCGRCVEACPTKAIDLFARRYTLEEAVDTLLRDKLYYERSGGGVTIGGGEATMQAEFSYALLKRLQAEGVHVAIDTCGYTTAPLALRILEEADLLLFDLKGFDRDRHKADTGVSNEIIHRNLLHLGKLNKDIIIRLPLIPGHTDDEETLRAEARLIAATGSVRRIDLLPYHDYGRIKYEQLDRPYLAEGYKTQTEAELAHIKSILAATGIPTQIGG